MPNAPVDSATLVIKALVALLRETADVISSLPEGVYAGNGATSVALGPHIRHSLDHITALIEGAPKGRVSYDRRERGGIIETEADIGRDSLLRAADILCSQAQEFDATTPLEVQLMVDGQGVECPFASSLGRELMFVYSHAIHHNAIVAQVCRQAGMQVPSGFGYAPSTLAHLAESSH